MYSRKSTTTVNRVKRKLCPFQKVNCPFQFTVMKYIKEIACACGSDLGKANHYCGFER